MIVSGCGRPNRGDRVDGGEWAEKGEGAQRNGVEVGGGKIGVILVGMGKASVGRYSAFLSRFL